LLHCEVIPEEEIPQPKQCPGTNCWILRTVKLSIQWYMSSAQNMALPWCK